MLESAFFRGVVEMRSRSDGCGRQVGILIEVRFEALHQDSAGCMLPQCFCLASVNRTDRPSAEGEFVLGPVFAWEISTDMSMVLDFWTAGVILLLIAISQRHAFASTAKAIRQEKECLPDDVCCPPY